MMLQFTEKLKKRADIYKFMCIYGETMLVGKDFACQIEIEHLDGSKFDIRSCSWDECEDKIYVWSEHCGYMYFFKDDLRNIDAKKYEWTESEGKFELLEHTFINFHFNG